MMPNDNGKRYMIKDMMVYISLERWAWKGRSMWGSVMGRFQRGGFCEALELETCNHLYKTKLETQM